MGRQPRHTSTNLKQKEKQIIDIIRELGVRGANIQQILKRINLTGVQIKDVELRKSLKKMRKNKILTFNSGVYKINFEKPSPPTSENILDVDPNLAQEFKNPGKTRASKRAQDARLRNMTFHPPDALKNTAVANPLLSNLNLLTLIYFEFRCTLFKEGDSIKLFNREAKQWNSCRLGSRPFQGNVINTTQCIGGPKYVKSTYDVQGTPYGSALLVRSPLVMSQFLKNPNGKFFKLLRNLYPFESCYSSDRGKVTFANVPEKIDFFIDDGIPEIVKLNQVKNLCQRWEEWCERSKNGQGSALALNPEQWENIKNAGLKLVTHNHPSSQTTDETPSGKSIGLEYFHDSTNNTPFIPTAEALRVTPKSGSAPFIVYLYNNGDIGQEMFSYDGNKVVDTTGRRFNHSQITKEANKYFSKNGIEAQLYRQLYVYTRQQQTCGGGAITAIAGLQFSSLINSDGSSNIDSMSEDFIKQGSESIVVKSGSEYILDPILEFTENDQLALDKLNSSQSFFSSFSITNSQYTISPGIWIIVDIPRMPHSILVILKGGKKYTIGAGYDRAPTSNIPGRSDSQVPLLIYSPDTSIYSVDEARSRPQQFNARLDYEVTKDQQIRKIGSYNSDIMNNLIEIMQNSTRTSQSTTPELMTTFRMNQNWAMYQTLPITPGTMNCTCLSLWITNQITAGFCAPGGIINQIRRPPASSDARSAAGPLGDYLPNSKMGMGGRRRKQIKKRRRHKTKKTQYRKKGVRNKNKRRTRKNKKTKRSR